jgi:hypothetical protein
MMAVYFFMTISDHLDKKMPGAMILAAEKARSPRSNFLARVHQYNNYLTLSTWPG